MLASIVLPRPTSSARMARPPICRSTRWATSIWWGSSLIALASRVINRSKPGTRATRSASRRRSYQARSAGAPRSCSANTVSERSSTDQTSSAGGVVEPSGRVFGGMGLNYVMHRAFVAALLSVLTTDACTHRPGAAAPDATPSGVLTVAQRVEHLDVVGREPMVVEHPDGSLFVAGYGEPRPTLWKSRDRGATWTRVDVGSEAQGAIGNSDVDLAVGRDGTLYFVNMLFDRAALEGRQIAIGVSRDTGATWAWTTLSQTRFDDRPWVAVAPQGEVAVRIVPLSASGNKFDPGVDLIAVSTDGGTTWQKRPAPGQRDWSQEDTGRVTPRWVEPLAWDGDGRLYALWTDTTGVWLARSADRGGTWTSWRVVSSRTRSYYPYLVARGHGDLAATWFSGVGDDIEWHAARLQVRDDR